MPVAPGKSASHATRIAGPRGLRVRLWNCPNCAYDLSGLPDAGVCPECGDAYESGWLHVSGWSQWSRVPLGPRRRARLLAQNMLLALALALVGHLALNQPVGRITMVAAAVALFIPLTTLSWVRERNIRLHGQRAMHLFLGCTAIDATGTWRPSRIPWSRFARAAFHKKARGIYQLTLAGPTMATLGYEFLPSHSGLWRIRIVFEGSKRDAALVRRIVRERITEHHASKTSAP